MSETTSIKRTLIVPHLGNGASMCAILEGRSVETTMSFSPLDGLTMGTRCGRIDAAVVLHLLLREGWSAISGIIALILVLSTTAWIAVQGEGDTALLIALAATLPRQIEIHGEGPREGFQMEQATYPLDDRLALIDALAASG